MCMFLLVFLEDGMAAAWREILKRVISRMKNFPPPVHCHGIYRAFDGGLTSRKRVLRHEVLYLYVESG
jgi:hypothetical protein